VPPMQEQSQFDSGASKLARAENRRADGKGDHDTALAEHDIDVAIGLRALNRTPRRHDAPCSVRRLGLEARLSDS
jgi:hypothetical protein